MTEQSHRPILWSTLEEYEGDADALARQGGGEWNSKPTGFAEALENLGLPEVQLRRRTFLKMSGFAAVLAMAAGCQKPAEKILPYVTAPEDMVPGVPNYYASTCGGCAAGCGLLVKTYEGRPIKLEGNPSSPVNRGTLCARGQASLIDLYDPDRLRRPLVVATGGTSPWEALDEQIARALRSAGSRAVLLTGTIHGPARTAVVAELQRAFPGLRHVVYDALADEAAVQAREMLFGQALLPRVDFASSEVTVLFGADPMAEGASPVEAMAGIGASRKVREKDGRRTMGRLYAFEPLATLSGMNADYRFAVRPSDLASLAIAVASELQKAGHSVVPGVPALGVDTAAVERRAGLAAGTVAQVAADLWAHRDGRAVVVAGGALGRTKQALDLHLAANLINAMIGAEGTIVDSSRPSHQAQGSAAAMLALVEEMKAGGVEVLLIEGTNPAYSLPASAGFAAALGRVRTKVSFSTHRDETAALCDLVLPGVHFLENWGDAEPHSGHLSLRQPTMGRLWDNRPFEESLMRIAAAGGSRAYEVVVPAVGEGAEPTTRPMTWHEFVMKTWEEKVFASGGFAASRFEDFWFEALRRGTLELPARQAKGASVRDAGAVARRLASVRAGNPETLELATFAMPNVGDGRQANNPWLLELPDPVSRVCWDNFVALAPATARAQQVRDGDILEVTVHGQSVLAPARIHPGMHVGVAAVGTGWGRTAAGAVGNGEGFNAFALGRAHGGELLLSGEPASIRKTGRRIVLADVQGHNYMKRDPRNENEYNRPLVQATSLELLNKHADAPQAVHHIPYWKKGQPKPDAWGTKDFDHNVQHKWAMAIDLNACTGCGACMVACQAENNIPVVGKREVLVGREMHWIRIDRYYKGDLDNPEIVKQPMLCQHCDNAPCETVCPVLATVHSADGLNQQVYNRCVGTRYCANNCPYKVRRFNFYEYSKFRKGPHDELEKGAEDKLAETPLALALNPEITVRTKGIMEKCTFCQQRIRLAKDDAKKQGRPIPDGGLKTACQQTCPPQAIVFGDVFDENHEISRVHEAEAERRGYGVLEEFNVRPNVMYLAHIWNRETRKWDVDYHTEKAHGKHDDHGAGDKRHSHSGEPAGRADS
jgi:molybdopterin-containing oxidoreductase family iron-sulfur binding subunit